MDHRLYQTLKTVRRRQRWQTALHGAAWGLLASALAGIGLGIRQWVTKQPVSTEAALAVLLVGPVVGGVVGLVWRKTWQLAAIAVDRRYNLKDRAVTALEFLRHGEQSVLHRLQVDDAVEHLSRVEASRVVPLRLPRTFLYANAVLLLAVGVLLWPRDSGTVQAGPEKPRPEMVEMAEDLQEDLDDLEKVAREADKQEKKEINKLVKKLRKEVEAMKEPGVEVREALARISKMQQAMAAQQAKYNEALVDAQLESLGSAMMAADSLKGAAQKLKKGDYEKAAEELENLEDAKFSPREARAVAERMKKQAREMQESGLGQMSQCVSQMCEGIQSGKSGKMGRGARRLASMCRKQAVRKKISFCLGCKLAALSMCKGRCKGMGIGQGENIAKSDRPSQKAGKGATNKPLGEKTDIDSSGKRLELTGTPGEGPSTVEVTNSPEGRQQAKRSYREVYQEYQKRSEAVLESEPIPLGHRQTIRRYFELIRPQGGEGETEPASR